MSSYLKEPPASQNYTHAEDDELVSLCLEGDSGAWEALISRYQRLIYSVPLKARLSQDDAADVFQSVCLKLYEKLGSLRQYDKIGSWLVTTTTRESWRISAHRRREAMPFPGDESGADALQEIPDTRLLADEERQMLERQQVIRQGMESLSGRCRELLELLFYQKEEFSYADIARRLNMPIPSIGPTRARCLEKLKKLLHGRI